ncbi:MAG: SDR family oxidoreductase [Polyangiaceae bacterium]|nr:SDR family oxidoreductase [Polyangiaceae bacterium]MCL4751209.1 SDR family oxidoreductase [Myxococcales bacterium]
MEGFFGTRALVTGASSGIGAELARQLATRGANLILTARSKDKLDALAEELRQKNRVAVQVVVADLAQPGGAQSLAADVDALGVDVDHLVNNAGFGDAGALVKADPDKLAEMVRLNCEAVVVLARHFLPPMLARRRGGVLNVASTAAFQPMPYMAVYAATKAFVLSFSAALAKEAEGNGVTVTALCPGPVPTGFQAAAGIEPGVERIAALSAEETAARALSAYAAGDTVCVPGAVNRVQTVLSKLAPRELLTSAISIAMKRAGRVK